MSRKVCILFPGQGAQYEGMSLDIINSDGHERSKEVFDLAKRILSDETYNGIFSDIDTLSKTKISQVAIYLNSMALYRAIEDRISPECMIGLSLGEYSALTASGFISLEEGISLVEKRGQIMSAGVKNKGTMMAVLKADRKTLQMAVEDVRENFSSNDEIISIANYNSKDQIVVGGSERLLSILKEKLDNLGIKKTSMLNVEGPFHTEALRDSSKEFSNYLEKLSLTKSSIPVYSNFDFKIHDIENIKDRLLKQMYSPVYFEDCAKKAYESGCETFIEVGAGGVLSSLVKKIDRKIKTIKIQRLEDIEKLSELGI